MKRFYGFLVVLIIAALVAPAIWAQEIQFVQWWRQELKKGTFDQMIANFQKENPSIKIKLVTLPYSEVRDQLMIQTAGHSLPQAIGLDAQWLNTLIKNKAVENLESYVSRDNFDVSKLALHKVGGSIWSFPVTVGTYPLFYNIDLFQQAGISEPPKTWDEFAQDTKLLTNPKKGQYGWVIPLDLGLPNGLSNDILPWILSEGYDIMKDGKPYLNNKGVIDSLKFIKGLYKKGYLTPGVMSIKEPDKLEEFANGRAALMIGAIPHVNILRMRVPDLHFALAAVPSPAGYKGKVRLRMAGWDIGIAASASQAEKEATWKFVKYLVRKDTDSFIASNVSLFPGNTQATPSFIAGDPLFQTAFKAFVSQELYYPLVGAPDTVELERSFLEQFHYALDDKITIEEAVEKAETAWNNVFAKSGD